MITNEQLIQRRNHLGASDIPAVFGYDPFKSAVDVFYAKCYNIEKSKTDSEPVQLGNAFETPLLAWAAEELNVSISADPDDLFYICEENEIFSCTLDARIMPLDRGEAIEAKVSSRADEWGDDDGGDQIPDRVNLQVQSQMLCANLKRVYVVALLSKNGIKRKLYRVERSQSIIDAILKRGTDFWNKYIVPKVVPPESEYGLGSIEIIKRVQRQPSTWAEVPDEFIEAWDAARKARLEAEKVEKEALERMLTPLGDAEGVQLRDGRILTYFPTVKKVLDQRTLKSSYPDIYEQCLKDSVSRTPRIKEA